MEKAHISEAVLIATDFIDKYTRFCISFWYFRVGIVFALKQWWIARVLNNLSFGTIWSSRRVRRKRPKHIKQIYIFHLCLQGASESENNKDFFIGRNHLKECWIWSLSLVFLINISLQYSKSPKVMISGVCWCVFTEIISFRSLSCTLCKKVSFKRLVIANSGFQHHCESLHKYSAGFCKRNIHRKLSSGDVLEALKNTPRWWRT